MSCVDVQVIFPGSFWTVNPVEVTLAIIFGLLVGVVIAIVVARCFFQELAKDRIQQAEKKDWTNSGMYEKRISYAEEVPLTEVYHEDESPSSSGKNRRSSSLSAKDFRSQATIDSYDEERAEEEDAYCCLITALTKTSMVKTQTELSLQDYRETQKLEEELHQEKTSVFLQLLRIILSKFVAKERLDEEYTERFLDKYSEMVESAVQAVASEQAAAEDEIRQKLGVSKDPLALEEALEKTRPESTRKMVRALQDAQLKIQDDLAKETDLSDEEIDALVEKLTENMAEVERMIGEEAARQANILQERLERRRALAQQYSEIKTREETGNQTRLTDVRNILEGLVDDKQLLQEQCESIVKQYEADLAQIQENHQAEVMSQSLQLSEKLRKFREKKLRKLEKQQEEEMEELTRAASKAVNISDFVQAHHNLLEQHRDKSNSLMDELDHREAEDVQTLRQQLEQNREESIAKQEESLFEILAERARLSEKEAAKIMRHHTANVKAAEEKQEELKKQQQAEIQERLAQRKALWEEEQQRLEAEQRQLAEQQAKTVSRLLDTQSGLDEEARRQIMLQHEQNTLAVNNQLQMAKMKQQKLLEARLAQRRARMELLKERQEEELEAAKSDRHVAELKEQHAQEVAAEMKAIEQAKAELRSRLALETKEALKAQDEQLGILIGKLQVGQARRQGIIKKQDKAIKELQEQMVDTVSVNQAVSEHQTDRIIKRHMREIEEVEEKMREARAHQAKVLQDKYEAKKLLKEKTIVSQLEEERKEITRKQSGSALTIMSQMLLETRHKQAMSKLEQEMKRELAEQKEELNQQLERAMIEELEEQEKNFLGQLAVASEMSRDDLKDLVNTAVAEGGGDSSDVKKLSKDLTQRIKTARAQPDEEEEEDETEEKPRRKGKKAKAKKK
ncbi:trichohyalin-like isoform X2 [Acanthaster planci]|uniref:Trichohyalin-like isoform X2 n=1 Tax=Acanthaster planci TaxID=133434 RepID=A0A8B7YJV1_ACAPL|nr:trichohyalin-like isoform X2 [Acanthaster planci]